MRKVGRFIIKSHAGSWIALAIIFFMSYWLLVRPWWIKEITSDPSNASHMARNRAAVASVRNLSKSANPESFFTALGKIERDYDDFERNADIPNPLDITVSNVVPGEFVIEIREDVSTNDVANPGFRMGTDLETICRRNAVYAYSEIVWVCGDELKHVKQIHFHRWDADNSGHSCEFEVVLDPNPELAHFWPGDLGENERDNSRLRRLVADKMRVVNDTAAYNQWGKQ